MLSRAALTRRWWRFRHYVRQHVVEVTIAALIFLFLIIYFAGNMFITIPSGSVGVLWERFTGGTVLNRYLGEGFHIIMPWNKIFIYDTRVQLRNESLDALSADGLDLQINVAYQFELIPASVPTLHQYVGPNYIEVMIAPDIAARARDIFSQNTPQEIYSERRADIQKQILDATIADLHTNFNPYPEHPVDFIRLEDVLVRSITLPPSVESAINSKNEQQQQNEEYDYRILREAKESERKRIEALGIKDFQDIVSRGITESYLRWQGIEATLELAKSPNSKVVIIGGGKDGLPIILGNSDGAPGVAAAPAPSTSPVAVVPPATPATPSAPLDALLKQMGIAPKAPATAGPGLSAASK